MTMPFLSQQILANVDWHLVATPEVLISHMDSLFATMEESDNFVA